MPILTMPKYYQISKETETETEFFQLSEDFYEFHLSSLNIMEISSNISAIVTDKRNIFLCTKLNTN